MISQLPRPLVFFGLSGLLPQMICLALWLQGGQERWFALAAACCYAAIILSFLGGMWWIIGLLGAVHNNHVYAIAVVPSLIGWAALLAWCVGWPWPGPSLAVLGFALLVSPLIDFRLAKHVTLPTGWLRLRVILSSGLGLMTLLIAAASAGGL
jgi:hypothetical protein